MNALRLIFWTLSLVVLTQASTVLSGSGSVLASWIELGPEGVVIARVVTTDANCPPILLDGVSRPMDVRAEPSADYPVLVCEAVIVPGITLAEIDGQPLPLPKANPKRIVAFGDAGCRIKPPEDEVQDCNDPSAWPAEQVSQRAATEEPDLVIHVGDIIYRERPCPPEDFSKCGTSPTGYNWDTFNADFFTPQVALLRTAPWVFVRGDHEVCTRAGSGWFLFFDPRPMPENCQDFTDPYTIQAGDLQLQVFDSSMAHQDTSPPPPDPNVVSIYSTQLAVLRAVTTENAWFLTHKPIWGIQQKTDGTLEDLNVIMQEASANNFLDEVKLILAGHIHIFETLTFDAPRPRQVVVGTGGTALDPDITLPVRGTTVADAEVESFESIHQFGYLLFKRQDERWKAAFRNATGETLTTFRVPE